MARNRPIALPGITVSLLRPEQNDFSHMLSLCYAVAAVAHEGQINKDKTPYITHPLRLVARWQNALQYDEADRHLGQMVALLHDVLEDTDFTEDMLRSLGIHPDVINAVQALTMPSSSHCTTLPEREAHYLEHIQHLIETGDRLAMQNKFFDLEDNMDLTRLTEVGEWELAREAKYHKAWLMLREELS